MGNDVLTMEEKKCPYLNMTCQRICPAWLEDLDDCVFHICLTQVKDIFFQAAEYLDEKLDLPEGVGVDTLTQLRKTISGNATEGDKLLVRSVINGFLTSGVLGKIQELTISDLASMFSTVEKVIHFDLASLFSRPEEDADYGEDGDGDLTFTE